jgi:hypothetical protein
VFYGLGAYIRTPGFIDDHEGFIPEESDVEEAYYRYFKLIFFIRTIY